MARPKNRLKKREVEDQTVAARPRRGRLGMDRGDGVMRRLTYTTWTVRFE